MARFSLARFSFGRGVFGRGLLMRGVAVLSGLLVASLVAFPSFPSPGPLASTPPVSVDRTAKGDQLPLGRSAEKTAAPSASQTWRDKAVPIGCERAFSPISAPRLADVFRRCTA
jgi:hypothetical protein